MHTYRDIYNEIRSRKGYGEAESYQREIERDGHSLRSSVWSQK